MNDVTNLLKVVLPGLVLIIFVGGFALRIAVKPTIDAILRLREGLRSDQDQTQQRIARLEAEVARLKAGDSETWPALEDGSRSKDPVRRD